MAKKSYEYQGHVFEDNGHGDLYNGEVDRFLIFRPHPMMVQTIIHKDNSVTMNQEKFKENTDENKGVYEEGYEINDDGSVFVKADDVDPKIKEESEDNKNTSEGQEVQNRFEKEIEPENNEFDQPYDEEYYEAMNDRNPNGLNTKQDYEDDLKWFEGMEATHGSAGLDQNEDYQSLKEEYESKFNTTWNTPEELKGPHETGIEDEVHFAGEELYSDDPNRFGDKIKEYNEKMNPSKRDYRFDFGFKDGSALRDDAFDEAKAYLEEEDMAQYLDEPLKSKIDSMKWVLDDVDAVHVDVKANQPLTDEDLKALKSEIEGQNSDGLGEGFEQQDFAESYYDPDTGEGPYTRSEVMDIVQENYDNMEFDEYRDYIDYEDIRDGLESYLRDGNYDVSFEDFLLENYDWDEPGAGYESEEELREYLEQTPEEQLFEEFNDTYDAWLDEEESSFIDSGYAEDYINDSAIENAKYEVAKNDPRYNENLWGDGMVSMQWDIPDGVDVTPKSETVIEDIDMIPNNLPSNGYGDYSGLMIADQDKWGDYEFGNNDDLDRFAKEVVKDLNNNKKDDFSEFDYRINDGQIEIYDKNESVGSDSSDYDKLEKELKKQLGNSIYLEPYDSVTTTIAGIYGQRETKQEETNNNRSDDKLPMTPDEYNEFKRKLNSQEDMTFNEYRMGLAMDRYERGYNANDLSYQDLKDIQDYREMKTAYESQGQVISERYMRSEDLQKMTDNIINQLKSADEYSSIDIYGSGNYSISKYKDGNISISSSHPYDLSDYSFAKWSNSDNAFNVYNEKGYLIKQVKTIEEAIEEMRKIDEKIPSRIDRT